MRTREVVKRVTKSLVALGIVGGLGFGGYKWYQAAQAEPPVKPNPNTTAFSVSPAPITSSDKETTYIGHNIDRNLGSVDIEQMWTTKLGHDGSGNSVPDKFRILGVSIYNNTNQEHTYQVNPKNQFVGTDGKIIYGGNSTRNSGYLISGRKFDVSRLYSPVKIEIKSEYEDQLSVTQLKFYHDHPGALLGEGDSYDHMYRIKKGSNKIKVAPGRSQDVYFKIDQSLLEQGYSRSALLVHDTKQKQDIKTVPVVLGMSEDPNGTGSKGISGTDTSNKNITLDSQQHSDFDLPSLNVDKIKLVTADSGKPYLRINYSNHSNIPFTTSNPISYKIERKEHGTFKQVAVIKDTNMTEVPSKVKVKRIIPWFEKTLHKGQYRITVQTVVGHTKREFPKVWKTGVYNYPKNKVTKTLRVNSMKLAWYHVTQKVYGWFD